MTDLPLACTVRECGLPLTRLERSLCCPKGHSYDVARSGYINLLQPQDRRSLHAGDSVAAVAARARLGDAGVGQHLVDALVERIGGLDLGAVGVRAVDVNSAGLPSIDRSVDRSVDFSEGAVVVDLGSGSGELMTALARARPMRGIGIDLSTAAADHAARRTREVTWVVANADRRLPLLDQSVDLVVSVNGRRNPAECARVLRPEGRLLVAVPAPDDLGELRALVQGAATERSRIDGVIAEHGPLFLAHDQFSVRDARRLDPPALLDLLQGTYRGARVSNADAIAALASMDVTLSSDVVLFVGPQSQRLCPRG